jgi:hypothetical protein
MKRRNSDGLKPRKSTGKADGLCSDCLNSPPGEKALHPVKRNLLKQHGVLWYSEPVFGFFAREGMHSLAQSVALIPILKINVNFFS